MQTTITETSDPKSPLTYTGTLLGSNTSIHQTWTMLQTDNDQRIADIYIRI